MPGHELAGHRGRRRRPTCPAAWIGERVTVPFCLGCGACAPCRAGETQLCDDDYQPGFTGWGSFAQYVALPHAALNLVRLPEELGFVAAAALGCRFMTAYAAVAVHGRPRAGRLGRGARLRRRRALRGDDRRGGRARASRPSTSTRPSSALARELGAEVALDARDGDAAAAVREATGGGAHVSLDALGSAGTCAASVHSLRKRGPPRAGRAAARRTSAASPVPMDRVIAYELELAGVHGMAVRHYPALLGAIAAGRLDPARLVGTTVALEQAGAELAAMSGFARHGATVITSF